MMKKITLDMRHKFMTHNSEVVKSPSNARCVVRQALCVRCVDTSVPRREMLIWLLYMNLHTLII